MYHSAPVPHTTSNTILYNQLQRCANTSANTAPTPHQQASSLWFASGRHLPAVVIFSLLKQKQLTFQYNTLLSSFVKPVEDLEQ